MYFSEIRLINFGLYSGEHVLDVRPSANAGTTDRPIILIGGKNGAGKTTILEAVRLCLYGTHALGTSVKRSAYEAYLLQRIHRRIGAPLQHSFAGVGVTFVHTVDGAEHTFQMRRMWERRRNGVQERLHVARDGKPLSDQEMAWWDQFLHDLLPPGLADLFFFDGEKIQSLADDPDYTLLGASIRSLLGLDLLDRLRSDLTLYLARQKRTAGPALEQVISALQSRRAQIETEFQQTYGEMAHLQSRIDHLHGRIEAAERQLISEGGHVARQRESLQQRSFALREQIQRIERRITEYAHGLLPFALVPHLARELQLRLKRDEQVEHYIQVSTVADYMLEEFERRLDLDNEWLNGVRVSATQRKHLAYGIRRTAEQIRNSLLDDNDHDLALDTVVHPLERDVRREMIAQLDQAIAVLPTDLAELGNELTTTIDELHTIETALDQMPAEEHIQPILQQLAELQREVVGLELRHEQQAAQVEQIRRRREVLEQEEKDTFTRLMRGDDPNYHAQLAGRAQQVLLRYEETLRRAKIQELEEAITTCFGRLSRKGRYIRRVSIDPQTFATTLYNKKGDPLPREQLSAGEKQIYAVAVLWALRLVSGRSLPIIVDTPLGRLDSEHRRRLVQHYFPHASHQVIILSTDTEIDSSLYNDLAPAIGRTYQLDYRIDEAISQVDSGYFQMTEQTV